MTSAARCRRAAAAIKDHLAFYIEVVDIAVDGVLLETAVVRMELETIAPDSIAAFHLIYPDYDGKFSSYSVDFKLRDGEILLYKDMRSAHTGT